jgi:hypothetical protein
MTRVGRKLMFAGLLVWGVGVLLLFFSPDDDQRGPREAAPAPEPPDGETLDQPGPVHEPEVARAMHRAPV